MEDRAQLHGTHGFPQGRLVLRSFVGESEPLYTGPKAWWLVTQEGTVTNAEFALGTNERG